MKLRILAILTALLCFAALLVGCDKEIPPCAEHVDADKNAICDGCERAVVTIVEELPYEEPVVEMIVKPIPTGKDLTDYFVSAPVNDTPVLEGVPVELVPPEGYVGQSYEDRYYYFINEVEEEIGSVTEYEVTHTVWDMVTGKTLFKKVESYDEYDYVYERESYSVSLTNNYFCVESYEYDNFEGYTTTYTYYNYAGSKINTSKSNLQGVDGEDPAVVYLYFAEKVVAVNPEDFSVIYEDDANTFVERPVFNYVTENYGVCYVDGKHLVYDLNKWIDCVYAFEMPSAYENVVVLPLAEDKMVIQAYEPLLSNSINYDVVIEDAKYDIRYFVVDLAAKAIKEQEFGYVIDFIIVDPSFTTDLARNLVAAYEITDKKVDENKQHLFVVDENLDIVFACEPLHLAQESLVLTPVADGLFTTQLKYADNTVVTAVMDKNGFKNYLPREYDAILGMVHVDGVFYDYTLQEVFNYAEEGYTLARVQDDFAILRKVEETDVPGVTITKFYFYNGGEAPVALTAKSIDLINDYGFVTMKTATVNAEEVTTYTLYNANGEKIFDSQVKIRDLLCLDEESAVFGIGLSNGDSYIVR